MRLFTHNLKFIWKCYILPKVDYFSQLWGPNSGGLLTKLKYLQKDFTENFWNEGLNLLEQA